MTQTTTENKTLVTLQQELLAITTSGEARYPEHDDTYGNWMHFDIFHVANEEVVEYFNRVGALPNLDAEASLYNSEMLRSFDSHLEMRDCQPRWSRWDALPLAWRSLTQDGPLQQALSSAADDLADYAWKKLSYAADEIILGLCSLVDRRRIIISADHFTCIQHSLAAAFGIALQSAKEWIHPGKSPARAFLQAVRPVGHPQIDQYLREQLVAARRSEEKRATSTSCRCEYMPAEASADQPEVSVNDQEAVEAIRDWPVPPCIVRVSADVVENLAGKS